ncbi:hypothetical protein HWD29_gp150 [Klebsiella phage KpS8]|uniref:Uncharacterized protein n=1 Tax=Klebsiella phage KpS8 TaxID=2847815 RepID=A0A6H0X4E8_9CAUD|nr:hypothetical protein HWD29_gp150 [Klebsiella phage KpS8]QIW88364.1 hypothetical protein kps8_192 [Klebsiella phage KpS8]
MEKKEATSDMLMASTRYGNVFMKGCFIDISVSHFRLCVNRMYNLSRRGGDCILQLQEMWLT